MTSPVSTTHMPQQHVAENKLLKLQEKEYIIIKYPHDTRFWQLPQELHFRLDEESLVSLECLLFFHSKSNPF